MNTSQFIRCVEEMFREHFNINYTRTTVECSDKSDIKNWLFMMINEYNITGTLNSMILLVHKSKINDLITFKYDLIDLLDVCEELIFNHDDDNTGLEYCVYSYKYEDEREYNLVLTFNYKDADTLEITAVIGSENENEMDVDEPN